MPDPAGALGSSAVCASGVPWRTLVAMIAGQPRQSRTMSGTTTFRGKVAGVACSIVALLFLVGCQSSPSGTDQAARAPEEQKAPGSDGIGADQAAALQVVRSYYEAITERRYRAAYELWTADGAASGKSFEEFQTGFANTATVEVSVANPGPMGAAAGSRYLDIPVRISARSRDGTLQEFSGTYTLRRSVVDGATAEQRAWRIYSAKIQRLR